jgi:hypothetical protein
MDSEVAAASPPSVSPDAVGRMKALGCLAISIMRVLSPRIEPCERTDEGSIVYAARARDALNGRPADARRPPPTSTATRWPFLMSIIPSASMKVDLPAEGVSAAGSVSRQRTSARRSRDSHAQRWQLALTLELQTRGH